jgi:putative SOS response-associated peptidase YedK
MAREKQEAGFRFCSEKRDFAKSDRVLIPATGFYEYTDPETPKVKLKDRHLFTLRDHEWFWIAGIVQEGCFTMLTTEPGPDVEPYHDRQIIVLAPEQGADWLALSQPQNEILNHLPTGSFDVRTVRKNGQMVVAA